MIGRVLEGTMEIRELDVRLLFKEIIKVDIGWWASL
jgi:hypothetical protein